MQSLKKNKTLLVLFTISLIAFLTYQFGGVFTDEQAQSVGTDSAVAVDILSSLSEIQHAQIDSNLFTSSAWMQLVDYSITLPADTPGRRELFSSSLQSSTVTAPSTTTRP